jgi:hypothetical protein
MDLDRRTIAIERAPAGEGIRLDLGWDAAASCLDILHDEVRVGTFARVYRARLGQGDLAQTVAVKLQRDRALSRQESDAVAGKFTHERAIHRRLQQEMAPEEVDGSAVVRQFDVWPVAEGDCYRLPPCILCLRAPHALAPRCPRDGTPLESVEFLHTDDERHLWCPTCQTPYYEASRPAILEATVRRDGACAGCKYQGSPTPEPCLGEALFLNFFPGRLLLFELLDLDLEDYLRWRKPTPTLSDRGRARDRFREHRAALRQARHGADRHVAEEVHDLLQVGELFDRILGGVEHLHARQVAHLDVKPANVCLRFRGAELDVRIIDLGLADDPQALDYLRTALGTEGQHWTDYTPPEFRRPAHSTSYRVTAWIEDARVALVLPHDQSPSWDPLVCPGDLLLFTDDPELRRHRYRVLEVLHRNQGWQVHAARDEGVPWLGNAPSFEPFTTRKETRVVIVSVEKHCGFAADVYSLGLVLLALLLGDPDVRAYRDEMTGNLQRALQPHLGELRQASGLALVQKLRDLQQPLLQPFYAYIDRLLLPEPARAAALEMLGVVLRATLRGDRQVFYLQDRGGDARKALERYRRDLDAARALLRP